MKILDEQKIYQKIKRLAIQILENNHNESEELILIGINNTGMKFAQLIQSRLEKVSGQRLPLAHIKINPRNPLDPEVALNIPGEELTDKVVILIDDVANTGRTLFYACLPLMKVLPKRIETVVLIDRTHKFFPISVNYVGLSLATTMKENISVKLLNTEEMAVFLD